MPDTSIEFRSAAPQAFLTEEARVGDYVALLKPRVMSLVVFTGIGNESGRRKLAHEAS